MFFQFWLDDIKPVNKQVNGEGTSRMLSLLWNLEWYQHDLLLLVLSSSLFGDIMLQFTLKVFIKWITECVVENTNIFQIYCNFCLFLDLRSTIFRFCVKFYPPDPALLQEEYTRYCTLYIFFYFVGSAVSGQNERNATLWLVTWLGKMVLSCCKGLCTLCSKRNVRKP